MERLKGSDYEVGGNSRRNARGRHVSTPPPRQIGSLHNTPVSTPSTNPSPFLTPDNAQPIPTSGDFRNKVLSSPPLGHLLHPRGGLSGWEHEDDTRTSHDFASPTGSDAGLIEKAKAFHLEEKVHWLETSKSFETQGGNPAQKVKTPPPFSKRKRDESEGEHPVLSLLTLPRTSSGQENWLGVTPTPVASSCNTRLRRSKYGLCGHKYRPRKFARMG